MDNKTLELYKKYVEQENMLFGCDVSGWQPTEKIDWGLFSHHFDFIYIKGSEGNDYISRDTTAKANQCVKNQITYGLYHFARPSFTKRSALKDGIIEAKNFLKIYNESYSLYGTLPPVLDLEKNIDNLTKVQMQDWVLGFMNTVQDSTGIKPIIYSGYYFIKDNLPQPQDHPLGKYELWIPRYGASSPKIPAPWDDWLIWQFTDKGRVDGYNDNLDLNFAKEKLLTCN